MGASPALEHLSVKLDPFDRRKLLYLISVEQLVCVIEDAG